MPHPALRSRLAIELAIEALGGKVESMYYCLGDDDVVVIMDLPDNITAVGLSMNVMASGKVRGRITTLLTVEEADRALGIKANYRPPGEKK